MKGRVSERSSEQPLNRLAAAGHDGTGFRRLSRWGAVKLRRTRRESGLSAGSADGGWIGEARCGGAMKNGASVYAARLPDPAPLLEAALLASAQMLIARHPDLLLPPDVAVLRPPPPLRAARALLGLIDTLLGALVDYNAIQTPPLPSPTRTTSSPSSSELIPSRPRWGAIRLLDGHHEGGSHPVIGKDRERSITPTEIVSGLGCDQPIRCADNDRKRIADNDRGRLHHFRARALACSDARFLALSSPTCWRKLGPLMSMWMACMASRSRTAAVRVASPRYLPQSLRSMLDETAVEALPWRRSTRL